MSTVNRNINHPRYNARFNRALESLLHAASTLQVGQALVVRRHANGLDFKHAPAPSVSAETVAQPGPTPDDPRVNSSLPVDAAAEK